MHPAAAVKAYMQPLFSGQTLVSGIAWMPANGTSRPAGGTDVGDRDQMRRWQITHRSRIVEASQLIPAAAAHCSGADNETPCKEKCQEISTYAYIRVETQTDAAGFAESPAFITTRPT